MPPNSFFILKGGLHDASSLLARAKFFPKERVVLFKFFPNRPSTRAEAPAPGV